MAVLVLAEKPSVAQAIASALEVKGKKDGYIEGNGYIISWCVGHLVGLANADCYDARYSRWDRGICRSCLPRGNLPYPLEQRSSLGLSKR